MSRFPYPTEPLAGFEAMERDALLLERLAEDADQSAAVLKKLPSASIDAAQALETQAKRLRRIAACLGYMAGRLDRLHLLNDPVRRESNYGGSSQRRIA